MNRNSRFGVHSRRTVGIAEFVRKKRQYSVTAAPQRAMRCKHAMILVRCGRGGGASAAKRATRSSGLFWWQCLRCLSKQRFDLRTLGQVHWRFAFKCSSRIRTSGQQRLHNLLVIESNGSQKRCHTSF